MKLPKHYRYLKSSRSRQLGYSLMELLIASTLGLFILAGVVTTFTGIKDTERMRSTVSEMDSNARTAIEILRKNISLAGYSSMRNIQGFNKPFYTEQDENDDFTKGSINRSCGGGAKMNISGHTPSADQYTADSNNVSGRGDVLTAVILADNPCQAGKMNCSDLSDANPKAMIYTDCAGGGSDRDVQAVGCSTDKDMGMTNPTQAKIYSTFYLGGGNEAQKRTLYCRGNRGGTVPIIENVEYLQFLYGVNYLNGTMEYINANDVEAGNLWSNVGSVRVGLLLRSSEKNLLKIESTKKRYLLLDRNVLVKDMRRLYRVYTTTIHLANRNRGKLL